MIQELIGELEPHVANGCCSGDRDTTDSGIVGINTSSGIVPRSSSSGSATTQPVSWNFGATPAPPEAAARSSVQVAANEEGHFKDSGIHLCAGPHHCGEEAAREDQPALHRALHCHPRPQEVPTPDPIY